MMKTPNPPRQPPAARPGIAANANTDTNGTNASTTVAMAHSTTTTPARRSPPAVTKSTKPPATSSRPPAASNAFPPPFSSPKNLTARAPTAKPSRARRRKSRNSGASSQSALGIQENGDADRKDELTLEEMPFNDQFAAELTQQLEQQEKRQYWVELAPEGGLSRAGHRHRFHVLARVQTHQGG